MKNKVIKNQYQNNYRKNYEDGSIGYDYRNYKLLNLYLAY